MKLNKNFRWGMFARFLATAPAILTFLCITTRAQNEATPPTPPLRSELAHDNLSHVAASAGEIKAVLFKDAGLMIELKRWVAKEATDHGQVIGDSDLTNDAIFERLEEDAQFRAAATELVQSFGYLVPKLNPDSEIGKKQELLFQERAKWLAKSQEEELQQTSKQSKEKENVQNTNGCDPQSELICSVVPGNQSPSNRASQDIPSQYSSGPNTPRPANTKLGLMQTSGEAGDTYLPFGDASKSPQYLNGPNTDTSAIENTSQKQNNGSKGQTLSSPPGGFLDGNQFLDVSGQPSLFPGAPTPAYSRKSATKETPEPSELIRAPNPYRNIPSLYDMYVQTVARPVAPRRFGMEVFENGTRDSQLIPMDLPAGPDYVVGPGDGLSIDLWGGVSQRFYRLVDREGRVSLPEIGPVQVSGKSLADVQQNLQRILRTEFRDVSADVSLARLRTIRIYEAGDVVSAGAYDISSLSTPLNALFAAGGPTTRGSLRIVKHYRGDELVQVVDVYDLLLHGVKKDIERLENGDTVLVPPIGPQVSVEGMVRRPAIYELHDEKNLASVLELAGGLLPAAALRHIEVERVVSHDKQTMLSLDIPEEDAAAEVTRKLESFEVQDGDRVRIYPIEPYSQDTVYVEGHVVRPGRYSYREGMRLTDVISSYKELLPEPATNYAEIIRLNAPDFHPSVEGFNLEEAIANPSEAPLLHSMDTIRIFSRFDFENPPSVSVFGDVRKPGTYQTSGQIRLSDAVHLAGGLELDAKTDDAQVFRYFSDGKSKVFSVKLEQALAGNPTENILLQPRDRLLIHRNSSAVEPATVSVQGEVAKPGRYPLTTNMQVADLIRVGGGLKASAESQTADLIHYEWASQTQLNPATGSNQLIGQHETIAISAALAGDLNSNMVLHNGDVLTIRELPGWSDLGAAIRVKGEVKHPGSYGIRPGERLSSIVERAGGFQPDAYPYGAVLQRTQVRELESRAQNEMILRVKDAQTTLELLPDTDAKQKEAKEMALQQWQTSLEQLSSTPPAGRVAIRISSQITHWKETTADIEVRAGDTIVIPKKPSYVMVTGQVFNPTAISFRPGKSAKWYLSQSGGPTQLANKKAIFVIRADGSVAGTKQGMWSGDSLSAELHPGDMVVVPERALGGGIQWQNIFLAAQTTASVASAIFIAAHY